MEWSHIDNIWPEMLYSNYMTERFRRRFRNPSSTRKQSADDRTFFQLEEARIFEIGFRAKGIVRSREVPEVYPVREIKPSTSYFYIGQIVMDNVDALEKCYGREILPGYLIDLGSQAQMVIKRLKQAA